MTSISPIIQIPYLRPDPLHEVQGPLGGIGQALGGLGAGLEKRKEFAEQQATREQTGQALIDLRETEAGKLTLEQKKMQADLDAREQNRKDIDAAVAGISDPQQRQKIHTLLSLGNAGIPKESISQVADALYPMHGVDPRYAGPLAHLLSTGAMTVGQAHAILGLDPSTLPDDVRDFKPPKQRTVLDDIREQRLRLEKLQKAQNANEKEIQRVEKLGTAFDQQWDRANPLGLGVTPTPEQSKDRMNKRMMEKNRYLNSIAPNRADVLRQREQIRQQLQQEAGFSQPGAPGADGQDDLSAYMNTFMQTIGGAAQQPQ